MGCACVKSDVVVKNQKIPKQSSEVSGVSIANKRENLRGSINTNEMRNSQSNYRSGLRDINNNNSLNNANANNTNNANSINNANNNRSHAYRYPSSNQVRSSNPRINEIVNSNNMVSGSMPYLPSNNDPNFNMPLIGKFISSYLLILEDVIVGEGLKQMRGYISNIPMNQIEKKRAEYWGNFYY